MNIILVLLLFPLAIGIILSFIKNRTLREAIVRFSAVAICISSLVAAFAFFADNRTVFAFDGELINYGMIAIETTISIFLMVISIKNRQYLASLLLIAGSATMIAFEFLHGHKIEIESQLYVDKLTIIMICIIGVVGSFITIYSLGYMRSFEEHHEELKDKTKNFFALMFIFLSAMFGIVLSNNLTWLYFFWEITTVCSFLLIGYTKTNEAVKNSFRALKVNLFGGLAFVIAIVMIGYQYNFLELDRLLSLNKDAVFLLPVALLCFAGMTKAAQMPFSSWLLGAMVAPTPSSALLHSSTMVKAGVFIILRMSPLLTGNIVGYMVTYVGAITFLLTSLIAITQSDAKKVLAYSTVANLGLVVACGGIGTYEALWAGILLIIFHSVSKSLMFILVGTVDNKLGSRDIEDMEGLIKTYPRLALMMVVGIAGMFLAPFGMLISKWAAMKAFVDSGNSFVVIILVFGSAATLFYWTKWLGKIMSTKSGETNTGKNASLDEMVSFTVHSVLTVLLCLVFPVISKFMLEPYLKDIFSVSNITIISRGDVEIMLIMVLMLILLPISYFATMGNKRFEKRASVYMAGRNVGDNLTFNGSMGKTQKVSLKNWYMESYFKESRLNIIAIVITASIIVVSFTLLIGGIL